MRQYIQTRLLIIATKDHKANKIENARRKGRRLLNAGYVYVGELFVTGNDKNVVGGGLGCNVKTDTIQ